MNKKHVSAILCSDLHLSLRPPVARSVEKDWLKVQANYLDQVGQIARNINGVMTGPVPIIVAGDLFDHYRQPPEMINWTIDQFRQTGRIFAVPGQHDLMHHSYEDLHKSAYYTLVKAGVITDLVANFPPVGIENLRLHGFPWGSEVKPVKKAHGLCLEVAVIHDHVWSKATGYTGAPNNKYYRKWADKLKGYDVAHFGDNHKTLVLFHSSGLRVFNPGSFMRRKADEIGHKPCVGLLYENGEVVRHYLDTSKDQFLDAKKLNEVRESIIDLDGFLQELSGLSDCAIDFREALEKALREKGISKAVARIVLETAEKK